MFFFKYMTKQIAENNGYRATFMPKPFAGLTGNGCHAHVSLWDMKGEKNLFLDESDALGLSRLAYEFWEESCTTRRLCVRCSIPR